ncbi:MAG: SurA N-terminal domain-containing protein [Pseudomonadota bacterium]
MLQNIGDKLKGNKWLTYAVLGSLTLVFAAWGAYGIIDVGTRGGTYAAKVNGEEISSDEINRRWQEQLPQHIRAAGGQLSDAQRTELQQQLLDSAIRTITATQHARSLGYRVSDDQVLRAYQAETAFQVEGKFNVDAARSRLAAAGLTETEYESDLRRSLLANQLAETIANTDFLTTAEARRLLALQDEEREVRFAMLQPEAFAGSAPVDAAAIDAYYKANAAKYTLPESVKLAYAELSLPDVAATIQVADDKVRERYEKDKASYISAERRRARHILITVDDKTTDAQASAQAKKIYERIKGGEDFAALAKEFSKDTSSAQQGGDLNWTTRTAIDKTLGDRIFAMKEGELSEPVKTQYGYHVLRLDGIEVAAGRSFEEVRAELAATMRNELATAQFGSEQDQLQERLERGGASLDALVKEFGLRRGEVERFERGAGGLPLGSDADLNREVFSDAVLNQRRVGGPAQLSEDRLTIFQVLEHHAPELQPLDKVRDSIVTALTKQRGAVFALAAADKGLVRLNAGDSLDAVASTLKIKPEPARFVGRSAPDLPVELRDAAFSLPPPVAGKPEHRTVTLEGGAVALLEVSAMRVPTLSENITLQRLRSQRELQRYSQRDMDAYLEEVMRAAKVSLNPQVFQ